MDFAPFDKRGYPVVSAQTATENGQATTVTAGLDRPLLDALKVIRWGDVKTAADLACGTGRTGLWLSQRGVRLVEGVDVTPEMLQIAESKRVYRHLWCVDLAATDLPSSSYDLCTLVLADEHLANLEAVYLEAARLLACFRRIFPSNRISPILSHERNSDSLSSGSRSLATRCCTVATSPSSLKNAFPGVAQNQLLVIGAPESRLVAV
jgi:SAM-dependent methyltransferase